MLSYSVLFRRTVTLVITNLFAVSNAEVSDAILHGIIGLNVKEMSELTYNINRESVKPCSKIANAYPCDGNEIRFADDNQAFCCTRNLQDRTWTGSWFSPLKEAWFKCEYRHKFQGLQSNSSCGSLICTKSDQLLFEEAKITGNACDTLKLFGQNGKAYTGVIQWDSGKDTWFK